MCLGLEKTGQSNLSDTAVRSKLNGRQLTYMLPRFEKKEKGSFSDGLIAQLCESSCDGAQGDEKAAYVTRNDVCGENL